VKHGTWYLAGRVRAGNCPSVCGGKKLPKQVRFTLKGDIKEPPNIQEREISGAGGTKEGRKN